MRETEGAFAGMGKGAAVKKAHCGSRRPEAIGKKGGAIKGIGYGG